MAENMIMGILLFTGIVSFFLLVIWIVEKLDEHFLRGK